jgi:hypothetical protein
MMGEHRLRKEQPAARSGPHGHAYYCRNRCGRVALTKGTNESFVERRERFWGWCRQCREDTFAREAVNLMQRICAESATQQEALKKIAGGVVAFDGQRYDLIEPLKSLPAFQLLPKGAPARCAVIFRHPPHDACDGNPTGLVDPVTNYAGETK